MDFEETNETPENSVPSNKDNFKNTLCYVPLALGAGILFFVEENKSVELKKNIKYGFVLFVVYLFLSMFLGIIGIGAGISTLLYLIVSGVLGFKAYSGEKINIEYIDKVEEKIKEKM